MNNITVKTDLGSASIASVDEAITESVGVEKSTEHSSIKSKQRIDSPPLIRYFDLIEESTSSYVLGYN